MPAVFVLSTFVAVTGCFIKSLPILVLAYDFKPSTKSVGSKATSYIENMILTMEWFNVEIFTVKQFRKMSLTEILRNVYNISTGWFFFTI